MELVAAIDKSNGIGGDLTCDRSVMTVARVVVNRSARRVIEIPVSDQARRRVDREGGGIGRGRVVRIAVGICGLDDVIVGRQRAKVDITVSRDIGPDRGHFRVAVGGHGCPQDVEARLVVGIVSPGEVDLPGVGCDGGQIGGCRRRAYRRGEQAVDENVASVGIVESRVIKLPVGYDRQAKLGVLAARVRRDRRICRIEKRLGDICRIVSLDAAAIQQPENAVGRPVGADKSLRALAGKGLLRG